MAAVRRKSGRRIWFLQWVNTYSVWSSLSSLGAQRALPNGLFFADACLQADRSAMPPRNTLAAAHVLLGAWSIQGLADRYQRMLVGVGAVAADFGERPIASHWPFVGSQFSGTLSSVRRLLARWPADCVKVPGLGHNH